MRKPSTNLTLNDGIKRKAAEIIKRDAYSSLTALVEQLIREKHAEICGQKKTSGFPIVYPPIKRGTKPELNEP